MRNVQFFIISPIINLNKYSHRGLTNMILNIHILQRIFQKSAYSIKRKIGIFKEKYWGYLKFLSNPDFCRNIAEYKFGIKAGWPVCRQFWWALHLQIWQVMQGRYLEQYPPHSQVLNIYHQIYFAFTVRNGSEQVFPMLVRYCTNNKWCMLRLWKKGQKEAFYFPIGMGKWSSLYSYCGLVHLDAGSTVFCMLWVQNVPFGFE